VPHTVTESWRVDEDEDGLTLAALVRKRLGGDTPWSRARSLCSRGKVSIDGVATLDGAARVARGSRMP